MVRYCNTLSIHTQYYRYAVLRLLLRGRRHFSLLYTTYVPIFLTSVWQTIERQGKGHCQHPKRKTSVEFSTISTELSSGFPVYERKDSSNFQKRQSKKLKTKKSTGTVQKSIKNKKNEKTIHFSYIPGFVYAEFNFCRRFNLGEIIFRCNKT